MHEVRGLKPPFIFIEVFFPFGGRRACEFARVQFFIGFGLLGAIFLCILVLGVLFMEERRQRPMCFLLSYYKCIDALVKWKRQLSVASAPYGASIIASIPHLNGSASAVWRQRRMA